MAAIPLAFGIVNGSANLRSALPFGWSDAVHALLALACLQAWLSDAQAEAQITARTTVHTTAQTPEPTSLVLVLAAMPALVLLARHRPRCAGVGTRTGAVRLWVWDTGIGIAAAGPPRVFDAGVQLSNPGRGRSLGLGLGLAILQRSAAAMGTTVGLACACRDA